MPPAAPPVDQVATVRVGGTRVTLETVVAAFDRGDSPEEIREQFPTLALGDIYAVLTYFVRHSHEVRDYVAGQDRRSDRACVRIEAVDPSDGLRSKLMARLRQ
jgi:uncharacterized protein (DUF433 family)